MTDRRTNRRTDTSPHITAVFFSSYELKKTLPVTMLLLFGPVTLLCGTFLFILLSEGSVYCEHHLMNTLPLCTTALSIHTGTVRQCCSPVTNSGVASEAQQNFTRCCIWNFQHMYDYMIINSQAGTCLDSDLDVIFWLFHGSSLLIHKWTCPALSQSCGKVPPAGFYESWS